MMFIENWLAAVTFAGLFLLMLIPCAGWYVEGMRLEKSERLNKRLISENAAYKKEIKMLKMKLNIYKLMKDAEEGK